MVCNHLHGVSEIGIGSKGLSFMGCLQTVGHRIRRDPDLGPPALHERSLSLVVLEATPSDQRDELALGIGIAVDVPLGRLDRSMSGQQLNVA